MSLGSYLLHQFARPHGRLGGLCAGLMNRGNAALNQAAIAALELPEGAQVLDVGFGGAAALAALLGDRRVALAAGIDPSAEMVRAAEARFAEARRAGRLEVRPGTAESLPWPAASFDRALSVNSIYYWPDPAQGARELFRVLRPGGAAVIGLRSKAAVDRLGLERHGFRSLGEREVADLLAQAGFAAVRCEAREDRHGGAVLVRAAKAAKD
jgi:arsenite methyltransferase